MGHSISRQTEQTLEAALPPRALRPKPQSERFTTTNSERYAPLIKMKKIEKGQRSAGFCRRRPGDSATEASLRQQKSEVRTKRLKIGKEHNGMGSRNLLGRGGREVMELEVTSRTRSVAATIHISCRLSTGQGPPLRAAGVTPNREGPPTPTERRLSTHAPAASQCCASQRHNTVLRVYEKLKKRVPVYDPDCRRTDRARSGRTWSAYPSALRRRKSPQD